MAEDAPFQRLVRVGEPTPRIDGVERVTGTAVYTADRRLPGMLYARVLRSPHPHARVRRIDASAALALPGVRAVIHSGNCRVAWGSGDSRNTRYLFNDPVRFVGDPVAAVAATDRDLAEEALDRIEVEYETLRFVLDPEEALEPGAPEIHAGGNLSPDDEGRHEPMVDSRGDVEAGLHAAARVFEGRYTSAHVNNGQLERRAALAHWEDGALTLYASTQGISNCHRDMCRDLELPEEKVRVVCSYMGGGFGNKNQNHDFDLIASVLAREADAPVLLELSRKEDYVGVHGRWPTRQQYSVGLDAEGTLTAIRLHAVSGMGPYRKGSGAITGVELYRCPNVEVRVSPAYTNVAVAANYRAPSYPQGVFGVESVMDEACHGMGIDPVAFRLKNLSREYHDELPYIGAFNGLEACLKRGAERFGWADAWRPPASDAGPLKRGVGVAMGAFSARVGRSSAVIRLDSAGRYHVHVGVTDVGTGAKTAMALIAAEALEVPLDRIEVVWGDTDRCPYSVGESGSRTTSYTGWAVIEAARDLKRQLADQGAPRDGAELVGSATPQPRIEGAARYSFAADFVEIEVDAELGGIRVTRFLAVHDSGRIVNPLAASSQVKGGVIQGIGMALHEELHYDPYSGVALNAGYYGARVMTHLDAPVVEVEFVESDDGHGPWGAKPIGEPPIVPVVAAIANAFFNATGRRIHDLPMDRRRVLEALA